MTETTDTQSVDDKPLKQRPYEFAIDYPDICEWWRAREASGWRYVPASALPKTGIVVEDAAGVKICVVFLYACESAWGWLEWLTTNPKGNLRRRKEAIQLAVKTALGLAKEAGIGNVLSSLNNENLIELFEHAGFERGQGGMTDMIWRANP